MKITQNDMDKLIAMGATLGPTAKLPTASDYDKIITFSDICQAYGLPRPTHEFVFAYPRKWRFDYAWPENMIALEVEGGVWTEGRHTRGKGFIADMEKYNTAVCLGWRILRVTPQDMNDGTVFKWLKDIFK